MTNIWNLVIVLVVIVISTVLHELAHGYVAYLLGDTTAKEEGRLSLNPLRHVDPVMSILVPVMLYIIGGPIFGGAKPVPVDSRNLKFKECGMALVAVAGPLTNFLLAFLSFVIAVLTGVMTVSGGEAYFRVGSGVWAYIFSYAIYINLGFGIFNLIPIPPLDGSRILYAAMPDGARKFMEYLEAYGLWLVLILVWVFGSAFSTFTSGVMEGIIKVFIFLTGGGWS